MRAPRTAQLHAARLVQAGRDGLAGVPRVAQCRRGPLVVSVRAACERAPAHRPRFPGARAIPTGRHRRWTVWPPAIPCSTSRPGGSAVPPRVSDQTDEPWWKSGVLYQIYPRSFADSNADGVGDIPGLIAHLDHLAWLGVDGIWLSPVTVSPNADWGYDVSDFCAIAPEFGTLDDFDRLVAEADRRGIHVLMDIVPNHTSEHHPWFVDARSSRTAAHRDWYVWADGKADGAAAEQLVSSFGGPGWTLDGTDGPVLLPQPSPGAAGSELVERGRARHVRRHLPLLVRPGRGGFRIDVCNVIIKDAAAPRQPSGDRGRRLRDTDVRPAQRVQRQPPRGPRGDQALAEAGRRLRGTEALDRRDAGPGGQAGGVLRRRFGRARAGLQFQLHQRALRGAAMRADRGGDRGRVAAGCMAGVDWLQPRHVPLPHPLGRGRSRQGPTGAPHVAQPPRYPGPLPRRRDRHGQRAARPGGPPRSSWCALLPLLRGPRRRPHAHAVERPPRGRIHRRRAPWLPLGDLAQANVAAQREDPNSLLTLCRDVIVFRRRHPGFSLGATSSLDTPQQSGPSRGSNATWCSQHVARGDRLARTHRHHRDRHRSRPRARDRRG